MTVDRPTSAEVKVMLHRCGLSQTDAADYLDVQARLVRRWIKGERYPNGTPILPTPQHWAKLVALREMIETVATKGLRDYRRDMLDRATPLKRIDSVLARTQEEAMKLGWPCVGAQVAMISRLMDIAPEGVRVRPVHADGDDGAD